MHPSKAVCDLVEVHVGAIDKDYCQRATVSIQAVGFQLDVAHLKSTKVRERLNQELKCGTHVIRIFPNPESCLRLIRVLAVEIHEDWLERYLNIGAFS